MANTNSIRRLLEREGFTEVYGDISYPLQGMWVRETDGCFDVITATALGDACGADGQTLVEARSLSFDFANKTEYRPSSWRSLIASMDTRSYLPRIAKDDKSLARLVLASDFVQYGLSDPAGYGLSGWIAVHDPTAEKDASEKWTDNRVWGWGYAAIQRAVENCIAACNGAISTSAYHETREEHNKGEDNG